MTARNDNERLRVLAVCFSGTLGGLELATLRRAADLTARGHHAVVVLPDSPVLVDRARSMGLSVEILTPRFRYYDLLTARTLRGIVRREKINLILTARSHDLSTTMLAAGRTVAVVYYRQMQSGVMKRDALHNRIYRRLDGCITLTRRGRDELLATTVLDPGKIAVVPYGIDSRYFSPDAIDPAEARSRYDLPEDAFVIGIIGGFSPGKGQRDLLLALDVAYGRDPAFARSFHALFVGERDGDRGDYTEELRVLRDALPFADRIHFHPFVADTRYPYRALDVFVLASHSETFGMVVQEAMAMERAVIGTDAGGVPEIIEHGRTGLLVPPRDPEAIAEAILRLWNDSDLRSALAKNARSFVQEAYDYEHQYAAFERALHDARRHAARR